MSGPSVCFNSRTFSARSPFKKTLGCQSLESRVFEATYFVAVMTFGQKFECVGQYFSQPSKVLRPSSRSIGFARRSCTTAPVTSSANGKNHPPCLKPSPSFSSFCMTPSSVMNSHAVIFLIILVPLWRKAREQIFQIFQLSDSSFLKAHFDHLLQTFKRLVVDRDTDLCRSGLFAETQIPIRTGQL